MDKKKFLISALLVVLVLAGTSAFLYVAGYLKNRDADAGLASTSVETSANTTSRAETQWISLAELPPPPAALQVYRGDRSNGVLLSYDGAIPHNRLVSTSDATYPSAAILKLSAFFHSEVPIVLPPSVDVASFAVDPDGPYYFAKDKNGVYYSICDGGGCGYEPISNVDPATFAVFSTETGTSTLYSKDKNGIYWNGNTMVAGADAPSFAVFLDRAGVPNGYAKDLRHVYSEGVLIDGADVGSFSIVADLTSVGWGEALAKDNKHVYCGTSILEQADPASFSQILFSNGTPSVYSKDDRSVYHVCTQISGADAVTFMPILNLADGEGGEAYSKDKDRVYYRGEPIMGADSPSFVGVSQRTETSTGAWYEAKDANHFYYVGRVVQ